MKHWGLFLVVLAFTACHDDQPEQTYYITPEMSGIAAGCPGIQERIAISSNCDWSIESTPEWCSAQKVTAGGREYLLPITEIRPKKEFFDFQAKYEAGYSDEITPAEIAPQTAAELHRLALAAYKACRCRGIVRVDFIVTPEGRPYLIEINTIPGMSAGSIVPKQVRAAGMTLGELYDLIIADTCGRKP